MKIVVTSGAKRGNGNLILETSKVLAIFHFLTYLVVTLTYLYTIIIFYTAHICFIYFST